MLGILAFAVIVWMTEALDYAVSAVVIAALMVFLLAFAPDAAKPAAGWARARRWAGASGFSNSAVTLVAAALFHRRGHDGHRPGQRIALRVLTRMKPRPTTS